MRKYVSIFLAVILGLFFLQCSRTTEPENSEPEPQRNPAQLTVEEQSLLNASNRFGLKLFREINAYEPEDKNLFVSPLSVSYALGMTLNGAGGDCFDSMAAVLEHQGLSLAEINESYKSLTEILESADPTVVFNIANSIWSRPGKEIQKDFITACLNYFDAPVRVMDFPDPADSINHWVDVNTNGKITEIIKPPISGDIAMLLLNAIYFKGDWHIPFDTEKTVDDKFYLSGGGEIDCKLMFKDSDEDTTLSYFENDLFQAVTVPYGDEGFCMSLFLPKEPHGVDDIVVQMTEANWNNWLKGFVFASFKMYLPKFKMEYEIDLSKILKVLGMGIAFDPGRADFSNLFVDGVGWIDQVKHKTFVQVDEKGTEAAAVTSVSLIDSVVQILSFNRPFLFVIHEQTSGAILFMGKMAEPEWED
ncbi:MAG: serpin family protein [candidate division Zixibacteria bacterium]|nr:serpin family protein [candidate division Zixibacteria bacterium]